MLPLILALMLATAPCDKTDNECLLNLTLQQTYALEASQQQNQMMQKQLTSVSNNGTKLLFCGFFAGVVVVVLAIHFTQKPLNVQPTN